MAVGGEIKYRVISKILRKNGFSEISYTGSHVKWKRDKDVIVVVATGMNHIVWNRLCREHNLRVD